MFFFFLTTVCVKLLGLYLPLYMFCSMRASISGLMSLLVLCFFSIKYIHSVPADLVSGVFHAVRRTTNHTTTQSACHQISTSPPLGRRSSVMAVSVCVCICLSVREHISGTTRPIFTHFFVHVAYGRRSSLLLSRRRDTVCTFDLWITSCLHIKARNSQ